jgi:Domain of unknown function (DUF4259)
MPRPGAVRRIGVEAPEFSCYRLARQSRATMAAEAIAAIEALARLQGNWGERSSYTAPMDAWVEAVRLAVPPALAGQAVRALDRIVGPSSELHELWAESEELDEWLARVADLRGRVRTA